jgi:cyanophycin synthetase
MKLVEVRELDGPNIFLLEPAMKVEVLLESESDEAEALSRLAMAAGIRSDDLGAAWITLVDRLHEQAGLTSPDTVVTPLEAEDHVALAFGWTHRRAGRLIATAIADLTLGTPVDLEALTVELATYLQSDDPDDRPEMISDAERRVPTLGITGTNGKTTTTRLIAHIAQTAGKRPGWCSTSGVFIAGECVLNGDYTGPAGARRVLLDETVDVAVLETARGGILLRGLGYESNDVSVFINVSADHLGLLGVHTVEGLAQVKTTVIAVTKPDGFAVLNADDPLVWGVRDATQARVVAVSQHPQSSVIEPHLEAGGAAMVVLDGEMVWRDGDQQTHLLRVEEIPITYGGRATHMVENALHAAAAGIALGYSPEVVANALRTFASSAESNPGRLNAYRYQDATVLLDFAHNEAGLTHLLQLARNLVEGEGKVLAVIGSAGDRPDVSIRAMARIAGELADAVYARETAKYLRGRSSNEELNRLYREGLRDAGTEPVAIYPSELTAIQAAVNDIGPGGVVVAMSYEQGEASRQWLLQAGASPIN